MASDNVRMVRAAMDVANATLGNLRVGGTEINNLQKMAGKREDVVFTC